MDADSAKPGLSPPQQTDEAKPMEQVADKAGQAWHSAATGKQMGDAPAGPSAVPDILQNS